jgi:iron complex outermembrane receptor protein
VGNAFREPSDKDYWNTWEGPDDLGVTPLFRSADTLSDGTLQWRDPLVKPETAANLELGWQWRGERWRLKLNAYEMILKNEIVTGGQLDDEGNVPLKGNVESSSHAGLELEAAVRLPAGWRFSANGTLSRHRAEHFLTWDYDENWEPLLRDYSGHMLPLTSPFLGNWELEWRPGKLWGISLSGNSVGPRYLDFTQDDHRKLAGYTLWNAAFYLMPQLTGRGNLELRLQVKNLLDREYESSGYYDAWAGENCYYPGAGRRYYLSARVVF